MDDFSEVQRQQFNPDQLKRSFSGVETVERNYSQALQDIFVLTMLNGKQNGTYVEIGGAHPTNINNTYLLEKNFNWTGISFNCIHKVLAEKNIEKKAENDLLNWLDNAS